MRLAAMRRPEESSGAGQGQHVSEAASLTGDRGTSHLLDASAVLAWLQKEPGADEVDGIIEDSAIGAANWSEVLQKAWQRGLDGDEVAALLAGLGLEVAAVTAEVATEAARLWSSCADLSLGDRLCLAAGKLTGSTVWTTDRTWAGRSLGVDIQVIR